MKKELLALVAIALAFSLVTIVQASTYNLELSQIGSKIVEKHSIQLDTEKTISIELPKDASSISSNLNYSLKDSKLNLTGKNIEVSYLTQNSLEKTDDGYFFISTIKFYADFNTSKIRLILDRGYFIDKTRIFPQPVLISTDGQQITLEWAITNQKEGSELPIFIAIQTISSNSANTFIWVIILALILIISYWLYQKYGKKNKQRIPKKSRKSNAKAPGTARKFEDVEKYLVESEKAVLNELRKADRGELWQKQLQLKTNFSKAKLSRVIRNLEARNLVEKIPFGNTNKVRLK